jgi:hypothetical protein
MKPLFQAIILIIIIAFMQVFIEHNNPGPARSVLHQWIFGSKSRSIQD